MRPIIQSKKHIVQIAQFNVAQAATTQVTLVEALEAPSTAPSVVGEGAIVKAVFVELWLGNASSTVVGSYTCVIVKNPGGTNNPNSAALAALHDYTNKKNVLYTSQALVPPTDGGQVAVLRNWIKVPKGKQRFGLGDKLQLAVRNNNLTSVDVNGCGLAVYKEYS